MVVPRGWFHTYDSNRYPHQHFGLGPFLSHCTRCLPHIYHSYTYLPPLLMQNNSTVMPNNLSSHTDTIAAYPFPDTDPFVLLSAQSRGPELPDILFCGNQAIHNTLSETLIFWFFWFHCAGYFFISFSGSTISCIRGVPTHSATGMSSEILHYQVLSPSPTLTSERVTLQITFHHRKQLSIIGSS